jgi:hypothetical protein
MFIEVGQIGRSEAFAFRKYGRPTEADLLIPTGDKAAFASRLHSFHGLRLGYVMAHGCWGLCRRTDRGLGVCVREKPSMKCWRYVIKDAWAR